jgi:hypothetical protein
VPSLSSELGMRDKSHQQGSRTHWPHAVVSFIYQLAGDCTLPTHISSCMHTVMQCLVPFDVKK